jgi:hypothetical protein
MIRLTMLLIIMELMVTVPRRKVISCIIERIMNMVLRLVALRAAPAENACSSVAETSSMRINDKPIGIPILVMATIREIYILARSEDSPVNRPPLYISIIKPR